MCKNWTTTIAGVIIIIVSLWPSLIGAMASAWVAALAALVAIIVTWSCRCECCVEERPAKKRR